MIIKNTQNSNKNYNIFIALLRMYLSFIVVNVHCFTPSKYISKRKYLLKILKNNIHVPTFFILSFYFCHDLLISKNIKKIKHRFERLIIPYLIWPIIIWIINKCLILFFDWEINISFNKLKIQLLTGHSYMTVLWFQYNLIFITLLVVIIEFLILKDKLFIFINFEIIAYYFQYSDLNYKIFSKFNYHLKYPFGRFLEVMPFCMTGYILSSLKIIAYLKKNIKVRIKSIFILSLIFVIFIKCNILISKKGFMYQGLKLQIISLILFFILSLMPSEKIQNEYLIKIIKLITRNSAGIYYLHVSIKDFAKKYILLIKHRTLYGSLIIYIISYFICFIGSIIFRKSKLNNLFQ